MARFKIDENLPTNARDVLAEAGHDAVTVLDQGMRGQPDERVREVCRAEGRVAVTLDVGFADIRALAAAGPEGHPGVIVLRLGQQDADTVLDVLGRLIPLIDREPLDGRIWVVDETSVRIRSVP